MNTTQPTPTGTPHPKTARTIIGLTLITIAATTGAAFGHYTSPNNPAHATTTNDNGCTLICTHHGTGSGGTQPGPFTGGTARIGTTPHHH